MVTASTVVSPRESDGYMTPIDGLGSTDSQRASSMPKYTQVKKPERARTQPVVSVTEDDAADAAEGLEESDDGAEEAAAMQQERSPRLSVPSTCTCCSV